MISAIQKRAKKEFLDRTESKKPGEKFWVCSGPGCKAWESERVLSLIRWWNEGTPNRGEVKVCAVSCMNRCGGGVSIKTSSHDQIFKIRSLEEIGHLSPLAIPPALPCLPEAH